jgi:hypothetical protein
MSRKQRCLLVIVAGLALLLCGLIVYVKVSAHQREKVIESIPVPASVTQYERLAAMRVEEASIEEDSQPTAQETDTQSEDNAALRLTEQYQALFERHEQIYEDWNAVSGFLNDDSSSPTEEQWNLLAQFLQNNQDLFDEIHSLARQGGPVCLLNFSEGAPTEVVHLRKLRSFARMLRAHMFVAARTGKLDAVVTDTKDVFRLGAALKEEPILISQSVRFAISGIATAALIDSIAPGTLTRIQTLSLVETLDGMNYRESFADSMDMEIHTGVDMFAGFDSEEYFVLPDGTDLISPWMRGLYRTSLGKPILGMDANIYVSLMSRFAEAARLPYYEAAPTLGALYWESKDLPFYKPISRMIVPTFIEFAQSQARHEASLDLAQIGLLLELHAAENGVVPNSLDAIASDLGGTLPVDPFSGDSYGYVSSDSTFRLYSVGENQIDDGGATHDIRNGDLLWRGGLE